METPAGIETWDFATLASAADTALRLKTEAHSVWGLGRHVRWDLDQAEGILRFSDPKLNVAEATAQIAGTFDVGAGTWLWAWANESIDPRLTEHSRKVRAYGERRGFERLVKAQWAGTEADGWSMAAITVLLNAARRGRTEALCRASSCS
jgi:hypothetical protein